MFSGRQKYPHRLGGGPRLALARMLFDGNTVANYQPGNYTGTLNASAWANSIGAAPSLAQASGAAQPIIVSSDYVKKAYLPGVNGNYLSTPNAAANQITGDIAIAQRVSMDAWKPAAAANHLICKWGGAAASAFQFRVAATTGLLTVLTSSDGTNVAFLSSSSVAPTIADGSKLWVMFTLKANDGSGNNLVKFYTAPDATAIPTAWTQLGTTVTNVGTTSLFNANAPVTVGSAGTAGTLVGRVYRTAMFNGIPAFVGGAGSNTPAVDFNPADSAETSTNGATWVSSTTGETWTLNNTGALCAQIVASPQLLFDGSATWMQMTATIPTPYFVISVENPIAWTSANVLSDGKTSNSFAAQQITGTPQIKMYDGTSLTASISPTLNTYAIISAGQDALGNATLQLNNGTAATGTLNATALAGWTEGANGAATKFGNKQIKERIILSAIPSAAKLAQILSLLNAIHGVY